MTSLLSEGSLPEFMPRGRVARYAFQNQAVDSLVLPDACTNGRSHLVCEKHGDACTMLLLD